MSEVAAAAASTAAASEVDLLRPFVAAILNVFQVQCNQTVKPGSPYRKGAGPEPMREVSAVFGAMAPVVSAVIVISMEESAALALVGGMLGETPAAFNADVYDALMELINMIFGQAKKDINGQGLVVQRFFPTIFRGKAMDCRHLTSGSTVIVPLEVGGKRVFVEVTKEEKTI